MFSKEDELKIDLCSVSVVASCIELLQLYSPSLACSVILHWFYMALHNCWLDSITVLIAALTSTLEILSSTT